LTVEVTVGLSGSLLEMEAAIQEATNAVGRCATEEALKRFDADGSSMRIGEIKLTARIYLAAAPECGNGELKQRMEREIPRAKQQ
jgi:hypothetical protein